MLPMRQNCRMPLLHCKDVFLFALIATAFIISCGGQKDLSNVEGRPGIGGVNVIESNGIILEIPPGALNDDSLLNDITVNPVSVDEIPIPPPKGFSFLAGIELNPDGIMFNLPITITIPLSNPFLFGKALPLLTFDPLENIYKFESEALVSPDHNSVSVQIDHFSKFYTFGLHDLLSSEGEQARRKQVIIDRINQEVINHYEGAGFCFHDKGFLNFGDIDKFRNRIEEIDIVADYFLGNLLLDKVKKAEALYWPCGIFVEFVAIELPLSAFFCDEMILSKEPSSTSIQTQTFLHEMMHAIFDEHRRELAQSGVPDDEVI